MQIKVPKHQAFVYFIIDANNKCPLAMAAVSRLDASSSHICRGGEVQCHSVNTHKSPSRLYSSTKTNLLTCYRGPFVCTSYMKGCLIQLCDASLACFFGLAPFEKKKKTFGKKSKMAHISCAQRYVEGVQTAKV